MKYANKEVPQQTSYLCSGDLVLVVRWFRRLVVVVARRLLVHSLTHTRLQFSRIAHPTTSLKTLKLSDQSSGKQTFLLKLLCASQEIASATLLQTAPRLLSFSLQKPSMPKSYHPFSLLISMLDTLYTLTLFIFSHCQVQ